MPRSSSLASAARSSRSASSYRPICSATSPLARCSAGRSGNFWEASASLAFASSEWPPPLRRWASATYASTASGLFPPTLIASVYAVVASRRLPSDSSTWPSQSATSASFGFSARSFFRRSFASFVFSSLSHVLAVPTLATTLSGSALDAASKRASASE